MCKYCGEENTTLGKEYFGNAEHGKSMGVELGLFRDVDGDSALYSQLCFCERKTEHIMLEFEVPIKFCPFCGEKLC